MKIIKNFTLTGKAVIIPFTIFLLFLTCGGIDIMKTASYIFTHHEEIKNFQPYTVEQAKQAELKKFGIDILK